MANDEEKSEIIESEKRQEKAIKVNLYKNKLQLENLITLSEMYQMSHKDFNLFIESVEAQAALNEAKRNK